LIGYLINDCAVGSDELAILFQRPKLLEELLGQLQKEKVTLGTKLYDGL